MPYVNYEFEPGTKGRLGFLKDIELKPRQVYTLHLGLDGMDIKASGYMPPPVENVVVEYKYMSEEVRFMEVEFEPVFSFDDPEPSMQNYYGISLCNLNNLGGFVVSSERLFSLFLVDDKLSNKGRIERCATKANMGYSDFPIFSVYIECDSVPDWPSYIYSFNKENYDYLSKLGFQFDKTTATYQGLISTPASNLHGGKGRVQGMFMPTSSYHHHLIDHRIPFSDILK